MRGVSRKPTRFTTHTPHSTLPLFPRARLLAPARIPARRLQLITGSPRRRRSRGARPAASLSRLSRLTLSWLSRRSRRSRLSRLSRLNRRSRLTSRHAWRAARRRGLDVRREEDSARHPPELGPIVGDNLVPGRLEGEPKGV